MPDSECTTSPLSSTEKNEEGDAEIGDEGEAGKKERARYSVIRDNLAWWSLKRKKARFKRKGEIWRDTVFFSACSNLKKGILEPQKRASFRGDAKSIRQKPQQISV